MAGHPSTRSICTVSFVPTYCSSYLQRALTVEWWLISLALSVAFPLNYLLLQTPPPPTYSYGHPYSLQRDMWVIFGARAVEWNTDQYSAAYLPYLFVTVAVLTYGHSIMLNSVRLAVVFSVYEFQIIQREDCCVNTITMKKWLQTKILYKEDLDHDSRPSSQIVSRHTPNNVLIIMCNWNVKTKNWKK